MVSRVTNTQAGNNGWRQAGSIGGICVKWGEVQSLWNDITLIKQQQAAA
jgi:hypothetical protein